MKNKYNSCTSIKFNEEIKSWLHHKMQAENRSLSNLVNTIILEEMRREEKENAGKGILSKFKNDD